MDYKIRDIALTSLPFLDNGNKPAFTPHVLRCSPGGNQCIGARLKINEKIMASLVSIGHYHVPGAFHFYPIIENTDYSGTCDITFRMKISA